MSVISLIAEETVDAAWNAYAREAARLSGRPELLRDRKFNERLAILHDKWKRLFLMQEAAK